MLIIGLTGIIGAGKSTVAKIFRRDFDTLIIDADKIGHELLAKDQAVMHKVLTAFGTNKRPELARIVFNDQQKLRILNKITHPAIRRKVKAILQLSKSEKIILIDAGLLFTIGLHRYCRKIIFVNAPEELILQRLIAKGLTPREISLRLKANQKVLQLKNKCDYIIENNGSKKELIKTVKKLYQELNLI